MTEVNISEAGVEAFFESQLPAGTEQCYHLLFNDNLSHSPFQKAVNIQAGGFFIDIHNYFLPLESSSALPFSISAVICCFSFSTVSNCFPLRSRSITSIFSSFP